MGSQRSAKAGRRRIPPIKIYGLLLPILVRVLSEIVPINGSLIASHALEIKMTVPAIAGSIPIISVKKIRYITEIIV